MSNNSTLPEWSTHKNRLQPEPADSDDLTEKPDEETKVEVPVSKGTEETFPIAISVGDYLQLNIEDLSSGFKELKDIGVEFTDSDLDSIPDDVWVHIIEQSPDVSFPPRIKKHLLHNWYKPRFVTHFENCIEQFKSGEIDHFDLLKLLNDQKQEFEILSEVPEACSVYELVGRLLEERFLDSEEIPSKEFVEGMLYRTLKQSSVVEDGKILWKMLPSKCDLFVQRLRSLNEDQQVLFLKTIATWLREKRTYIILEGIKVLIAPLVCTQCTPDGRLGYFKIFAEIFGDLNDAIHSPVDALKILRLAVIEILGLRHG